MIDDAQRPLPIHYTADETRIGFRLSKGGRYLSLPARSPKGGDASAGPSADAIQAPPGDAEPNVIRDRLPPGTETPVGTGAGDTAAGPDRQTIRPGVWPRLVMTEKDRIVPAPGPVAGSSNAVLPEQQTRRAALSEATQRTAGARSRSDAGDVLVELFSHDRQAGGEAAKAQSEVFKRKAGWSARHHTAAAVAVDFKEARSERMQREETAESAEAIRAVLKSLQGRARG